MNFPNMLSYDQLRCTLPKLIIFSSIRKNWNSFFIDCYDIDFPKWMAI
jgi:hypothetical protein